MRVPAKQFPQDFQMGFQAARLSSIQAIQAIQDGSVRSVRSSAPAEKVARMTCRPNPLDLVTWHSMAFPNLTSTDICASPKGTKKGSEFIAERSHG